MTYPQNPQGQPQQPQSGPFPGQPYPASQPTPAQPYPGAPQQPFAPPAAGQPYPAYPGGPGVYQQKPNGATAIIAGILAIIGGIFAIISVIVSVVAISSVHVTVWQLYLSAVVYAVIVGLLLFGGIGLFLHKPAARLCTIIGCGLVIAFTAFGLIMAGVLTAGYSGSARLMGAGIGSSLIALIPPVATLVLAIVKPTADWVNYRPGAPAQGGYPAPQGW
ncbi:MULTISPECIES: hypothetical protein [Amycolatopsis]|uniref:Uncharacterized protein n=1 Tax=Amycolatopsis dendrobii TaxID=2760662 RepID=A0A7W3Z909_9PSEU|nr:MULTISPECIES: hypothetical protein [Amycolatopsis]MBB1152745.1 hypothetical protein [Amycolatopsis dendrobii]UKD52078.1 hypothetical protein L3Q65_29670 [Amycolatopsis sp. FU40]